MHLAHRQVAASLANAAYSSQNWLYWYGAPSPTAARCGLAGTRPQQLQRHARPSQLAMHPREVDRRARGGSFRPSGWNSRASTSASLSARAVLPGQPRRAARVRVVADRALRDPDRRRDRALRSARTRIEAEELLGSFAWCGAPTRVRRGRRSARQRPAGRRRSRPPAAERAQSRCPGASGIRCPSAPESVPRCPGIGAQSAAGISAQVTPESVPKCGPEYASGASSGLRAKAGRLRGNREGFTHP